MRTRCRFGACSPSAAAERPRVAPGAIVSSTSGPPRLGEWLIGRITRHDVWADVTTGDLREEHAALAGRRGRAIAHAWYWLQVLALIGDRARDGLASSVSSLRAFFSLGDRPMFTVRRAIVPALRMPA